MNLLTPVNYDVFGPSPFHVVLGEFEKARVLEAMGRKDEARQAWEKASRFWQHVDRPRPEVKEAAEALVRLAN